jgi:hypothetical protein
MEKAEYVFLYFTNADIKKDCLLALVTESKNSYHHLDRNIMKEKGKIYFF